ncbi:MAG: DUF2339 domain-containing protein, partial [Flavobacteriales bacterium]
MAMEGVAFILFLLILFLLGAPLIFFFLLRSEIQKSRDRLLNEIRMMKDRIRAIEKGEHEAEGSDGGDEEASPSPSPGSHQPQEPSIEEKGSSEGTPPSQEEGEQQDQEEKLDHEGGEEPEEAGDEAMASAREEGVTESSTRETERAPEHEAPVNRPPSSLRSQEEERSEKASRGSASNGWERFIGENLINKIGIGVLVLGIAFFVKYAIDQGWLGEVGRVVIGILAGTALIGVAHRLRKGFRAFSSVLAGGGLAVLYFTITIAFQEYQLFSQTAGFIIMVVITGFAVLLSIFYDKQELAVIALLGGFATPFLVSTGQGNYIVLFTYLIILDMGMLILAYYRRWTILNVLSYIATIAIYGGWYLE